VTLPSGAGSCPDPGSEGRTSPPVPPNASFFLPHIQVETRPRSKAFLRLKQVAARRRHGAEQPPPDRKLSCDLLEHTWSCTLRMAKGYHSYIRWHEEREPGKARVPRKSSPRCHIPQHTANFIIFLCLTPYRIFTLRAETGRPSRQPPALPRERGCSYRHGQTLLPVTKS